MFVRVTVFTTCPYIQGRALTKGEKLEIYKKETHGAVKTFVEVVGSSSIKFTRLIIHAAK